MWKTVSERNGQPAAAGAALASQTVQGAHSAGPRLRPWSTVGPPCLTESTLPGQCTGRHLADGLPSLSLV